MPGLASPPSATHEEPSDPVIAATVTVTAPPSKKKKRKRTSKPSIRAQFTIRQAPWTYIELEHVTDSRHLRTTPITTTAVPVQEPLLDAITAHLHLTAALAQFLGLHGSAIAFDLLRFDGAQVWVRVAATEASALLAAVGGWVGGEGESWRVRGWSSWDARGASLDGGQGLFGG